MKLSDAAAFYLGSQAVDKIYLGSDQVWPVVDNPNLITNGNFDSDTTGWSFGNGAILTVEGGVCKMTKGGGSNPFMYQAVALQGGKTYEIHVDIVESIDHSSVRLGSGPAQLQYINSGLYGARTYLGTYSPPSNQTVYLSLVLTSSVIGNFGKYDNVWIKEI